MLTATVEDCGYLPGNIYVPELSEDMPHHTHLPCIAFPAARWANQGSQTAYQAYLIVAYQAFLINSISGLSNPQRIRHFLSTAYHAFFIDGKSGIFHHGISGISQRGISGISQRDISGISHQRQIRHFYRGTSGISHQRKVRHFSSEAYQSFLINSSSGVSCGRIIVKRCRRQM